VPKAQGAIRLTTIYARNFVAEIGVLAFHKRARRIIESDSTAALVDQRHPRLVELFRERPTSRSGGEMYLRSLRISRFRSCEMVSVPLQSDLTVLVGENNGGKSNIVDAVRLLTLPLSGRRERYPEDDDLRRGSQIPNFEIEGRYQGLSPTLKGLLISAVPDPTKDEAIFGYRYPSPKLKVWSLRRWLNKLPAVRLLQKSLEINTQSMDQLRKMLYRDVPTVRINNRYTQPELATDMLEADVEKLGQLWQRGRDSARELEADLKKFIL
jgi:hypothetical protein